MNQLNIKIKLHVFFILLLPNVQIITLMDKIILAPDTFIVKVLTEQSAVKLKF